MKSKLEFVRKRLIYLFSLKYFISGTSWKAFPSDIAVKSRDGIKLHQERHNANSVISHNVLLGLPHGLSSGCFLRTTVIVF